MGAGSAVQRSPFCPHFAMLWVTSAILPTGSLSQRGFEELLGVLLATEVVSMPSVFLGF